MPFTPPRCPYTDCHAHTRAAPFLWRRRGSFRRACDGRVVQRFQCLVCNRRFSTQTFRLDYRLRKPGLTRPLFLHFVSKLTHRQSARVLGIDRKTVHARLKLLGEHCRLFHQWRMLRPSVRGNLEGIFQLDELETFETSRRLRPLTVPVLIEKTSKFVIDTQVATLPPRGKLSPREQARKEALLESEGRRKNGSRAAVGECLAALALATEKCERVVVRTDEKKSYPPALRRALGERLVHYPSSSKLPRNRSNPLFAINHTLAMLRDGCSRLVRRSWAHAKQARYLERHLWVWIAYRNYVRRWKAESERVTAAMKAGVEKGLWRLKRLLRWNLRAILGPRTLSTEGS